jgi:hypothetical protein
VSDTPDPLEAELGGLRPRGVSPELRRRVGERLNTTPARRWPWGVALVVVVVVGALAVLTPRTKEPAPAPAGIVPAPPAAIESADPEPSVLAYQRALLRSPEQLTALLDRHAATASDPAPVAAFTRSNATLDSLIGDD